MAIRRGVNTFFSFQFVSYNPTLLRSEKENLHIYRGIFASSPSKDPGRARSGLEGKSLPLLPSSPPPLPRKRERDQRLRAGGLAS